MEPRDVIHALRLWLPDGRAVNALRQELAEPLAGAFAAYQATIPGAEHASPAEVFPVAAAAA
ncbi:MAG TPA: hypothetical protein VEQ85_09985, partial [Lacipirellulaceae bacterium]|nr:hypothetical protein [Lacipirellulaceae bacterium]